MSNTLRKFIFFLLAATSITACAQCDISEGRYISAGGSEQSTTLILLADNKASLKHESWKPAGYEKRTIKNMAGSWSCNKNKLSLKMNGDEYNAELVSIGKNPLGLDENTKALHFKAAANNSILSNETLYLVP